MNRIYGTEIGDKVYNYKMGLEGIIVDIVYGEDYIHSGDGDYVIKVTRGNDFHKEGDTYTWDFGSGHKLELINE